MNAQKHIWPKAILIDLDGTLVDSVQDLASAVNVLLADHGHAELTLAEVRAMIGNGIKKLVQRAFAAHGNALEGEALDDVSDQMMQIYARDLTTDTAAMPGADDLVRACTDNCCKIAVVTNKPEALSREIVAHFGWDSTIKLVVGGDTCAERKPSAMMLDYACGKLGVTIGEAVMIGDSPADIDSAKNAGMRSIAVRGGYTNVAPDDLGADAVINTLEDIDAAFAALAR